uniref:Titin n=1 Tax=Sparus aurata TaxID=8175 RepID=A0A671TSV3_SPAAU
MAGEVFKLEASVTGRPLPSLVWTKEGKELVDTAKLEIKTSDFNTTLINKESLRRDGGVFTLTASNPGGFAKFTFNVKVLDRPGPPDSLTVTDVAAEKCVLNWLHPTHDGGAKIEYFIIQRRETSRLAWTNVATDLQANRFKVTKLLKGNEYIFRVMAVNKYGVGEPLESEPVICANPYVPSDPPQQPEVTTITKDSMVVCWERPEHDGGSRINTYIIERRDKTGLRWVKCNKRTVTDLRFKVSGLTPGHEYEFRVFAENNAGLSQPSPSSPFYKAVDTIFQPGPPGNPRVLDTSKSSITLAWNKPVYDGGSEITGYIVETCLPEEDEWTIHTPKKGWTAMSFTITNLKENQDKLSEMQVARDPCDRPGKPEAVIVTRNKVTLRWTKPEYDAGVKITGYVVEKKEGSGRWMKASFTNIIETEFVVTGLTEDQTYDQPSDSTGAITAKDEVDPPKIDLEAKYSQAVVVNADDTFRLEASISGKPVPTVHWLKEGHAITEAARLEIKNTDFTACIVVKEAIRVDGGQYTLLVKNVGGEKSVNINVKVLDRPGPPEGPISIYGVTKEKCSISWKPPLQDGGSDVSHYIVERRETSRLVWTVVEPKVQTLNLKITKLLPGNEYIFRVITLDRPGKGIVVRAGGSMRICIPFKGRPTPEVSWAKEDGELPSKVQIETGEDYTQLSIDICDKYDAGKYILNLENSAGTKSAFVSVKVLDTPGAPLNLTVKDITRQSVTLTWEPPLIDGGARIKNFLVEKRESTRKVYSNVDNKCTKTSYRITGLTEGTIYYFRVLAENEFGVGQPAETEDCVKTSEPPLSVGKVTLTGVTKTTASLSWEKPDHDGGSRIMGYYIEMQPVGSEEWVVATTTKICEGTVTGLSAGHEYLLRVSAFNEKGKSDPRALAAPVTAKDVTIEPRFKMRFNTYSLPCGDDLKIDISVLGHPVPKVEWKKDGQALKETTRLNVTSTPSSTKLCIKDANREDSGKYTVTATSSVGTATEEITVIILDKPGPPTGPVKIEEVSSNYVSLSWEPPQYTGGCQINNYIVEKRDTTTTAWQIVSATIARTTIKVTKLKTGVEYQFRVSAENRYGKSSAILSDAVIAQYPFSEPAAPGTPIISAATKDNMVVEWKAPTNNGGSPILGYHLERKEKNIKDCIRVDGGHFVLKLVNVGGVKMIPVNVKVLDRPGPP